MNEPMAVAVMVVVVAVAFLLMWRGWRRRAGRQAGLPDLAPALRDGDVRGGPVEGVYVGTTTAGDWTDRVVAHSLGRRGAATIRVSTAGVTVERAPEPDLAIAAAALRAVRVDRAGGGRAVRHDEYLIITWAHGDAVLDTAVRPDRHDDLEVLRAAAAGLVPQGATS